MRNETTITFGMSQGQDYKNKHLISNIDKFKIFTNSKSKTKYKVTFMGAPK